MSSRTHAPAPDRGTRLSVAARQERT
jgi:hypothetical protein